MRVSAAFLCAAVLLVSGCASTAAEPPAVGLEEPIVEEGEEPESSRAASEEPERPAGIYAVINTNKGSIVVRLEVEKTPMTVANFVGLAEGTIDNDAYGPGEPYYDGSVFHRVVEGHVIQAGAPDPERSEARGPGYMFPNEIHADLSHDHAGALGMANGGPHTNSAQFYITLDDRSYLDGDYIVFGEVVEGMDVVYSIVQGDVIESVRIVRSGDAAEAFRPDTESFQRRVRVAEQRVERIEAEKEDLLDLYRSQRLPGAIEAPDGLGYIVERPGQGPPLQEGERIRVRYAAKALLYRGHLLDRRGPLFVVMPFMGSPEGGAPEPMLTPEPPEFTYEIGSGEITPGFDETVRDMRRGEQRVVLVPAEMAYGSGGYYGPNTPSERRFVISPDTAIIYAIEIVDD